MKKLFALLLALSLTLALAACGDTGNESTKSGAETETSKSSVEPETSKSGADAESAGYTLAEDGVLTMATNAYFSPYEYYDAGNEIVGIDVDIAKAVAEKLGLELKIEDMEFNSIIDAVQSGRADIGLAGMTVEPDRLENVDFSDSYATGIQVVIVKEGSGIQSLDDLGGDDVLIGVQLGTTGDTYAVDSYGQEHVEEFNNGNDAIMALLSDKINAVLIDQEPAKNYVAANEGLTILETEYAVEDYAACIAKDNAALTEAVNQALAELKEEGVLQSIVDSYITAD